MIRSIYRCIVWYLSANKLPLLEHSSYLQSTTTLFPTLIMFFIFDLSPHSISFLLTNNNILFHNAKGQHWAGIALSDSSISNNLPRRTALCSKKIPISDFRGKYKKLYFWRLYFSKQEVFRERRLYNGLKYNKNAALMHKSPKVPGINFLAPWLSVTRA